MSISYINIYVCKDYYFVVVVVVYNDLVIINIINYEIMFLILVTFGVHMHYLIK